MVADWLQENLSLREETYEMCYNSGCRLIGEGAYGLALEKLKKAEGTSSLPMRRCLWYSMLMIINLINNLIKLIKYLYIWCYYCKWLHLSLFDSSIVLLILVFLLIQKCAGWHLLKIQMLPRMTSALSCPSSGWLKFNY